VNTTVDVLNILLPLLYGGLLFLYGKSFFKTVSRADKLKTALLTVTVIIHLIYVVLRTVLFNHPPITTPFEIMTIIAFCIAVAYLFIEVISKVHGTGMFVLIPAFFFQVLSSVLITDLSEVPEILRSNLLGFHVTSALLGYAAIAVGAMYGLLYLMLYHDIKSNHFSVIYKRLPNLEILESMSFRSTLFGFICLSIAIGIGLLWLPIAFGEIFYSDPKLIGSLFIWVLYAVGLISKTVAGWHGRKIAVLHVSGFIIAIFSITIINFFFRSFHQFY
jgi:HemX protein